MTGDLTNVLFATIRVSTPLILAAMAGVLSKQVNLLNIALEGLMLFGAMAGVVFGAWFGNPWAGLLAAMLLAGLLSLIFARFVIDWKANLIVAGLAVNILALGLTAYLLVALFDARGAFSPSNLTSLPRVSIPLLDRIPILGDILSGHGVMVYLGWISVLLTSYLLHRTPLGIHIRAVGEHKEAAQTAGIAVRRVQYIVILLGGILCGMGGAQLSIGDLALFSDNMTNGRGFIALAAVFFGAGNPWITSLGCLLFGFFEALQYRLQITTGMPPQLLQMMPYLIVVIILVTLALQKRVATQKRIATQMMLDLLVTGYPSIDYLFHISRSPGVDETAIIETGSDGLYGGCGLNVAVALARLGFKVGAAVVLGDDQSGRDYNAYLEQLGIDNRDVLLLPGQRTSRSYIFSNPQGGNQIFFYPGAAAAWQPPLQSHHMSLQQAQGCLVTVGDPRFNREFVRQSITYGLPIYWQMKADIQAYPQEQLAELLSASQVLFMNDTEAGYLMDALEVDRIEALQHYPHQVLALTLGAKGSQIYTRGKWSKIPAVPGTESIDPTGAGDGYTAGFLAARFRGYSAEICGRVGAVLASFVIEKTGCQTNLPDWKALDRRYTSFFQQTLITEQVL